MYTVKGRDLYRVLFITHTIRVTCLWLHHLSFCPRAPLMLWNLSFFFDCCCGCEITLPVFTVYASEAVTLHVKTLVTQRSVERVVVKVCVCTRRGQGVLCRCELSLIWSEDQTGAQQKTKTNKQQAYLTLSTCCTHKPHCGDTESTEKVTQNGTYKHAMHLSINIHRAVCMWCMI